MSRNAALQPFRPEVWTREAWIRFSGVRLMTRMVVLRLAEGLLLYSPSPAPLDPETRAALDALGPVRWLVAPNEIHHLGLPSFQAAWPEAHTTGCAGHPRRAPRARFDLLLSPQTPPEAVPWARELRWHLIGGNTLLHEIALLHPASGTLLLTDAVERIGDAHLEDGHPSALVRWMMQAAGVSLGQPCMSPEHSVCCTDPDALEVSLEVLEGWEWDGLIMSHGDPLQGPEAREALRRAFRDNIERVRRRGPLARGLWAALTRFV